MHLGQLSCVGGLAEQGWLSVGLLPLPCTQGAAAHQLTLGLTTPALRISRPAARRAVFVIKSLIGLGSDLEPMHATCTTGPLLSCYFSLPSLVTLCLSYLLLTALSSNLIVPGGESRARLEPGLAAWARRPTRCARTGALTTPLCHVLPPVRIVYALDYDRCLVWGLLWDGAGEPAAVVRY